MRNCKVLALAAIAALLLVGSGLAFASGTLVKETKVFYALDEMLAPSSQSYSDIGAAFSATERFPVRGIGFQVVQCPVVLVVRTRVYKEAATTTPVNRRYRGGWHLTRTVDASKRVTEVYRYFVLQRSKTVMVPKTVQVVEPCYVAEQPTRPVFRRGTPPGAPKL